MISEGNKADLKQVPWCRMFSSQKVAYTGETVSNRDIGSDKNGFVTKATSSRFLVERDSNEAEIHTLLCARYGNDTTPNRRLEKC